MTETTRPAGRELDALVAEKVMGCRVQHWSGYNSPGTYRCGCGVVCAYPHGVKDREGQLDGDLAYYSTDIAAAWEVVEKLRERGLHLDINNRQACDGVDDMGGAWWAEFASADYAVGGQAFADTAPLAICRAALAAVGA